MIGRRYFERGVVVEVLAKWNGKGPRNVLIERPGGERVVRPFRGLRRIEEIEVRNEGEEEEERKEKGMAKKETESRSEVRDPSEQKGQRSGSPSKAAHHEGPAGEGPVAKSKFGKEERDSVSEKEPGKSRGPGG